MIMKKSKLAIPAVAIAVLGFSLAGCGSNGGSSNAPSPSGNSAGYDGASGIADMVKSDYAKYYPERSKITNLTCVQDGDADHYECWAEYANDDSGAIHVTCDTSGCVWKEEW